jgi:rSAM/selenodomain-associated transferase 2
MWLQGEGDLGARLERILGRALSNSSFAIAIGADSPGLPAALLEQARSALQEADAVMGPCEDGGFYLLGLRKCPGGLLAGIRWSQADTFAQAFAKLRTAGLDVRLLDPWFDVDRPEDLTKLTAMMIAGKLCAPRTKEILKRLPAAEKPGHPLRCSVIIPVLNELQCLPQALADLERRDWVHEVIVVDGGSTDGTREWLGEQNIVTVVDAPPGRGIQINAGAKAASGDVLLFLHADCRLPCDAGEQVQKTLSSDSVLGGCFCVQFSESRPRPLELVATGINLRTRITHSATGEQAIFVRKRPFEKAGGCPDWPLFEDVELVRRVKKLGRFGVIRSRLTVSARRHLKDGVLRTVLFIYILRLAFWAGVSPFKLARWYQDPKAHLKPLGVLAAATDRDLTLG